MSVRNVTPLDPRLFRPVVQHIAQPPLPQPQEVRPALATATPIAPSAATAAAPLHGYLPQEDALILQARDLGKSWADIAAMLPGRSSKSVRRRYTETLRPKVILASAYVHCIHIF